MTADCKNPSFYLCFSFCKSSPSSLLSLQISPAGAQSQQQGPIPNSGPSICGGKALQCVCQLLSFCSILVYWWSQGVVHVNTGVRGDRCLDHRSHHVISNTGRLCYTSLDLLESGACEVLNETAVHICKKNTHTCNHYILMIISSGIKGSMAQDFVAGCFGGAGQLVSGHPFDTIKVHLPSTMADPCLRCWRASISLDHVALILALKAHRVAPR